MFTLLTSSVTSFFSAYLFRIIVCGIIIAMATTVYFQWKHQIQTDALVNYNKAQIEQNIKDQKEYQQQQNAINAAQSEIVTENTKKQTDINTTLGVVTDYLNNQTTIKDDHVSSDILKETINKLKGK